jgi:transcriptional antiterminator NusG
MSVLEIKPSDAPWYLLQVQSNFEDRVADTLRSGIETKGFEQVIHNILVPKEEVKTVKDGKRIVTARRLYPGYVMVQMLFNDDVWHFLKKTDKVRGFIGGARPTPMKASEVVQIFSLMQNSEQAPKPKTEYSIGQIIRVNDGPFKDFEGSIETVDYNRSRVKVNVTIFGRATPVELAFTDISID